MLIHPIPFTTGYCECLLLSGPWAFGLGNEKIKFFQTILVVFVTSVKLFGKHQEMSDLKECLDKTAEGTSVKREGLGHSKPSGCVGLVLFENCLVPSG